MDNETAQELIKQLITDRQAYIDHAKQTQQLLVQALSAANNAPAAYHAAAAAGAIAPPTRLTKDSLLRTTEGLLDIESFQKGSIYTGEDPSELDDSESWHVQEPLEAEMYDEEGLKNHIFTYPWEESGLEILQDVADQHKFQELLSGRPTTMFPTELDDSPDRSHNTHYSIHNVDSDGSPLEIMDAVGSPRVSRSLGIWNRIKTVNAEPEKSKKAVGRITTVREPSPLLFASLHYTMNKHFDMDELFAFLVDDDPALSRPHDAFADDHRHQRSFAFFFEYFTIVDEGCEPMAWQKADLTHDVARTHIPISRCSSVVALSLEGPPMGTVKNKHRRARKRYGNVYDPFAPYRVLNIQCYPDSRSSLDTHDASKHYCNGPEAFLVTLCDEYHDAAKRLSAVYKAITSIVEPPSDFIFSLESRDKLLFEDSSFTYSRRYFWAYNTLGIMNEDIQDMVVAYEETFNESVWDGTDKIIWPGSSDDMASSKHANWRQRMRDLRADIEQQIDRLKDIKRMNDDRMKMVKGLHNNLYNGTSVLESRRSVENAMITVQQGHNIRLLTLVTIFFLPLTFVTSVFGMTAIPLHNAMYHFAWATVAVCAPTYILIGSLNTKSGLAWWGRQVQRMLGALRAIAYAIANLLALFKYHPRWTRRPRERQQTDLQEITDPIWLRPEIEKRRRTMTELANGPRNTFALTPSNTMTFGDHKLPTMPLDRVESVPTFAGEKEPTVTAEDPKLGRLRSGTQTATTTGSPPPHRPSIGVVPVQGQVLPTAFREVSFRGHAQRRHTLLTIPSPTEEKPRAPDDASSESSESPRPHRSGMFNRLFRGMSRTRDDIP